MPDVSIAISAQDRYSSAIKSMAQITKSFSKDADEMEDILHKLNANKYSLKLDADAALKELKALEKQFEATGDEADGLKAQLAKANYDNIKRNLDLVTKGAKDAEKQMQKTGEAFRKTGNQVGFGGVSGVVSALVTSGIGQMVGQIAQQGANILVSSRGGEAAGTIFSSTLSSAISGSAIGTMALGPGIGTAIGAAAGAGLGAISGAAQNLKKQDDAFKSYVQEAAESQLAQRDSDITSGSSIAARRETDRISFSTLFKDRGVAEDYLKGLVDMANTTPFLYDDLTAMSKTLATYGFRPETDKSLEKDFNSIQTVLRTIGDAGAALSMSTSDMSMVAQALGRMRSSNKTTLEYLNILNDRGIGAVGMLAEAKGKSQGEIYDMISKGQIAGTEAVEIILQALTDSFAGSMSEQSRTFSGLSSTLEGMEQEMQNAYGEGYNEARNKGLQDQIDWLSGKRGEAQEEANRAIGAWQASLENAKEKYIRKAVDDAMGTSDYQKAKAAGDAAEMGRILMQAKTKGMNEYNASKGAQEALAAEKAMVESIRADTSTNDDYWDAGYERGQWYTKGLAAGIMDSRDQVASAAAIKSSWEAFGGGGNNSYFDIDPGSFAVGLNRVPYDNFPALLHEGERVLTASQARAEERGGPTVQVTVTGNSFYGSDAAMEDRVAQKVAREVARAVQLGG